MPDQPAFPILEHHVDSPSAFTPDALMESVRALRNLPPGPVPSTCVLEFDGDLTDWLVAEGKARPFESWPCFHTTMYSVDCDGTEVGIVARTIGGPYAVLIAEQLFTAGARLIVGLTSAGRIAPELPMPCLVIADSAIRDEGTSFHYLPPSRAVDCPSKANTCLARELAHSGWPVRTGPVWTTDAPYRETATGIERWRTAGVLAVEMQAASLFAFATARRAEVAVVAMVSNAVDHLGDQFDTGTQSDGLSILKAIARAGAEFTASK